MRPASLHALCLVTLAAIFGASASAQEPTRIGRTTADIVEQAEPQTRQVATERNALDRLPTERPARLENPDSPLVSASGPGGQSMAAATGVVAGTLSVATPNFTSVTYSEALAWPPDIAGAVGPSQFLTHVNGRIRVHSKTNGSVGILDVVDETFWAPIVKAPHLAVFEPRVRFDRLSNRWFMLVSDWPSNVGSSAASGSRILIAVTSGPTIDASTVFTLYYFDQDLAAPAGDSGCAAELPSLGIDANALYIGANMVCGADLSSLALTNSSAFVVRKSVLLASSTPSNLLSTAGAVTAFRALADPATFSGPFSPVGVDNTDPAAAKGYFVGVDGQYFGRLVVREVTSPGTAPSLGANQFLTVPSTMFPMSVQTPGGGRPLDALDDRLVAAQLRNGRLWTAHQIKVDSSGVASITGDRNGVRWYEINLVTAPPTLVQSGTIFDTASSNPVSYWVGSAMVSGQGHAAFGFTAASVAMAPGAAFAGRLAGDTAGTTPGGAVTYKAADANYVEPVSGTLSSAWGYYSATSLDPCDDMTMWTIQEFATTPVSGTFNWGARAVRLLAPPPATPASATPSTVAAGQASTSVTVTGLSTGGSGFYDTPATGMPACRTRLSATVGNGVAVNSVTYLTPTSVMLNLDTRSASPGTAAVTVTNPDGQQAAAAVVVISSTGGGANLAATKTVSGNYSPGGAVTYQVTLTNSGSIDQADNSGDEFSDVLPSQLSLVSATATSGVAAANTSTRTVSWNGVVSLGGSVTITINATVGLAVASGTVVSNQGNLTYDSDGDGGNDASGVTDDPGVSGTADPTRFTVSGGTTTFYRKVTPCRIFDTRQPGPQTTGIPLSSSAPHAFRIQGDCGVPVGATAVTANVTVADPTTLGDLRVFPAATAAPLASTINWSAGESAIANGAILPLSPVATASDKDLAVLVDTTGTGTVHLLIDITGYFR
jgi:uncharacterized repeat protein (TIGR01451 family)